MQIRNSESSDVAKIFELYRLGTAYMKSKGQVYWPEFPLELIETEIQEKRQWKILIDGQIACIWATTHSDALIWAEKNSDPAVYIHRIATNPNFRGQNLVRKIVDWADEYAEKNNLSFIRMDTVGYNKGLIKHYTKLGFEFLGTTKLRDTSGLPDHYNQGDVCLFQRQVSTRH